MIATTGAIITTKAAKPMPELCHRNRFCGLPIGVSAEPALTASASSTTSRASGSFACAARLRVSGTSRNRLTSLVTTAASPAENTTRSKARRRRSVTRDSNWLAVLCNMPLRSIPLVRISRPARAPSVRQSTSPI